MTRTQQHPARLISISTIVLLVAITVASCSQPEDIPPAPSGPAPTAQVALNSTVPTIESRRSVRTTIASSGRLTATVSRTATIEPLQESRVAAGTNGRVDQLLKREGSLVAAGETVIILDDDNLALRRRDADLAIQTAQINLAKAQKANQESLILLQSQLTAAQTNLNIAQSNYDEGLALLDVGGIARSELNGLQAQLDQAQSNYVQAQDSLARSQRGTQEDLALLELQIAQARNAFAQASDALVETRISAPFAGELAEMFVEEGEFMAAGSPAFRLVSRDRQLGRFAVPPKDAAELLARGEVYFRYQGLDYFAQIMRSSSAPNDQRLVEMVAELYASDFPIPAGSVAQLNYQIELAAGVLIPSAAISVEAGSSFVYLVDDHRTKKSEITIVAEVGGQAVVEGISEGSQLVSPLPADLRDNTLVEVVQ